MKTKILPFIIKYKIADIFFWIIAIIGGTINVSVHHGKGNAFVVNLILNIANFAAGIGVVYFILYYLKPTFLYKKKYLLFFVLSIISVFAFNFVGFYIQQFIHNLLSTTPKKLYFLVIYTSNVFESIIYSIFFLSISLLYDYFFEQLKNEMLQKEKLQAELNFLKGQINPHFLFNAINSIFILIDEDKEEARKHLHTFSEMLRYQLYDCKEETILLQSEIDFINHYLSIERIRKSEKTIITTTIATKQLHQKITPFILITFVENACKYVSTNLLKENFITLKMEDINNELVFTCINTTKKDNTATINSNKGIGLANTLRRLELIYKDTQRINFNTDDNYYCITLHIKL